MPYIQRHLTLFLVATCALLAGIVAPVCAQEVVLYGNDTDKPKVNDKWEPEKLDVALDNTRFFTISTGAMGYTVAQRETILNQRITEILSRDPLAPVRVGHIGSCPTIWVGDVRLVTVYPVDAAAAGMTQQALAAKIAAQTAASLKKTAPTTRFIRGISTVDVMVNGIVVFRLASADGFASLKERARIVEQRLSALVEAGDLPELTTQAAGADTAILAGGKSLVTVTALEAQVFGKDGTGQLAESWIKNLQNVWPLLKK